MSQLRIAVAMTTHDGERHLQEQLDSVATQTCTPDQIVIADDASTDRTWSILQGFTSSSPVQVQLLRQSENVGLRRNVQDAMRACDADVIALADQDDVWEKHKVATIATAFEDPAITLWFSDATLVDCLGRPMGATAWQAAHLPPHEQEEITSGRGLRRLLHGMTVTGATMALRSGVTRWALPLPRELEGADHLYLHDGWLAVHAYLAGGAVLERSPLTRYRQHAGQVTEMSMVRPNSADEHRGRVRLVGLLEGSDRRTEISRELARVHLVAQRLREADALGDCRGDAVDELLELESFLTVRALPRSAGGRRTRVLRQFTSGNYSRFANGPRTAVADLL